MRAARRVLDFFVGDAQADRVVPPTGFTARLTLFTAAAMAFLAVFALALSLASGRLSDSWRDALAGTSTLRLQAPAAERIAQTDRALAILQQTPGIETARALTEAEQQALLAPWFGAELPLARLPVPQLIEITGTDYDADGLRLRLQAELPGAVLDDHSRWRAPLVRAATRLQTLGLLAILLIFGAMGAMITLAANAALAANAQVISVLRLVGATDAYIAQAFVRRFTIRSLTGAAIGTGLGLIAVMLLPGRSAQAGVLTGLGFQGLDWIWPLVVPFLAGAVAYGATQWASRRVLGDLR
ncbi:cell division protein FtsX [Primorskyibacter sp. S187A]|uniref:cell division protein FtsX n=1 Tax=Primorskyibacter sp. S187A TaxID=3415130 RepID=UPI003C7DC0EE